MIATEKSPIPGKGAGIRTSVLILGYGAFGRAVHAALSHRDDLGVTVFARSAKTFDWPTEAFLQDPGSVHTRDFDVVVVAVPGYGMRQVLEQCVHDSSTVAYLSCVKGMDPETGMFPTDVITSATGSDFVAVMSGASFAHEMIDGRPVFLTLACVNVLLGRDLVARLESEMLQLELSDDVRGLEIAGVGKNIIALGAGIADGLDLGDNFRAAFIARGIHELSRISERVGGRRETVVAAGALADFILSCSSRKSRNYDFGWKLARGEEVGQALAEGSESAEAFVRLVHGQHEHSEYFESIVAALSQPAMLTASLQWHRSTD